MIPYHLIERLVVTLFIDKPELSNSYITPPSTHGII